MQSSCALNIWFSLLQVSDTVRLDVVNFDRGMEVKLTGALDMIAHNGVFSLEHNAPGCSGGVSHPVVTGLALCPLAARELPSSRRDCRAIVLTNANWTPYAYIILWTFASPQPHLFTMHIQENKFSRKNNSLPIVLRNVQESRWAFEFDNKLQTQNTTLNDYNGCWLLLSTKSTLESFVYHGILRDWTILYSNGLKLRIFFLFYVTFVRINNIIILTK